MKLLFPQLFFNWQEVVQIIRLVLGGEARNVALFGQPKIQFLKMNVSRLLSYEAKLLFSEGCGRM